jgi:PPK2 family polyphosphate:nucleotide phosphotransferase
MPNLKKISTLPPSDEMPKEEMKTEIERIKKRLFELQDLLYADHRFSVLVIVQGMDASGKDGLINHAFSGMNPAGIRVYSWKKPTETEQEHDFLWRIHQATPAKGMIHVFNRSHYEDIVVPTIFKTIPGKVIKKRFEMINQFENLLVESGTLVLKFYLHVSEKEQLKRIEERLTMPSKMWKYNKDDMFTVKERERFMGIYETIFEKCNKYAPWNIIPADKNRYKEYAVLKILLEEMEKLKLSYPAIQK